MDNFNRDWKHYNTSEPMNKYEMAWYCITFAIVLVAVIVTPLLWAAS